MSENGSMPEGTVYKSHEYRSAIFSECGLFRYWLQVDRPRGDSPRIPESRVCVFGMLNPSTATHLKNDPTVTRVLGYASRWGCWRTIVVNAYAFRATDPRELLARSRKGLPVVGRHNAHYIEAAAKLVGDVPGSVFVCGWGANIERTRHDEVVRLVSKYTTPLALSLTKLGYPRHPLYLRKGLTPLRLVGE